jgi:hypothetical protein
MRRRSGAASGHVAPALFSKVAAASTPTGAPSATADRGVAGAGQVGACGSCLLARTSCWNWGRPMREWRGAILLAVDTCRLSGQGILRFSSEVGGWFNKFGYISAGSPKVWLYFGNRTSESRVRHSEALEVRTRAMLQKEWFLLGIHII